MSHIRTTFSSCVKFHCIVQRVIVYILGRKKQETCWPVAGLEKMINLELLYRAVAAFVVGRLVCLF